MSSTICTTIKNGEEELVADYIMLNETKIVDAQCQGSPILHSAVERDSPRIFRMLLDLEGMDPNESDREGTPLIFNCIFVPACFELLLRNRRTKVFPIHDSHGYDLLSETVTRGAWMCVRYLIALRGHELGTQDGVLAYNDERNARNEDNYYIENNNIDFLDDFLENRKATQDNLCADLYVCPVYFQQRACEPVDEEEE